MFCSKAFDAVSHNIPLDKMSSIWLDKSIIHWVSNWLMNWAQRVTGNNGQGGADLLSLVSSGRTRGNGMKLCQGNFGIGH